jgi:hypothetical protein
VKDNLWVVTGNHEFLVKLGPDLSVLQKKKFPQFPTSSLDIDDENVFWFGTWWKEYTVLILRTTRTLISHVPVIPIHCWIIAVNDVKVDRDQNVWYQRKKESVNFRRRFWNSTISMLDSCQEEFTKQGTKNLLSLTN